MYKPGDADLSGASAIDWPNAAILKPDLKDLRLEAGTTARFVGPLISLGILATVAVQFRHLELHRIFAIVPSSAAFWASFALWYLTAPLADWIIFRRLWAIPAAGFRPLLGKLIGNEILLGYIGEVYFYDWARKRADLPGSPFGAIKDVAILSAIAGNAATLAMVPIAAPFAGALPLGSHGREFILSVAIVLASSIGVLVFRRRLFSLARTDLWLVFTLQLARIAVATGLSALLWHLALPGVALGWWLLLATIRLLISRLPFIPNKDLVFAGLAVVLVGHEVDIAALMTMMAGLILTTHLVLGAALMSDNLARGASGA